MVVWCQNKPGCSFKHLFTMNTRLFLIGPKNEVNQFLKGV